MGKSTTGSLIGGALKGLLLAILKLIVILIAWICRLSGLFLTKLGETIEHIIIKRH